MAESPKIETRLNQLMRQALDLYMNDKHLENESEILRSALGQFLEREGYLSRIGEKPGEYRVTPKPDPEKPPDGKDKGQIGFKNSAKGGGIFPLPALG